MVLRCYQTTDMGWAAVIDCICKYNVDSCVWCVLQLCRRCFVA